jgi:hypothetical protein
LRVPFGGSGGWQVNPQGVLARPINTIDILYGYSQAIILEADYSEFYLIEIKNMNITKFFCHSGSGTLLV